MPEVEKDQAEVMEILSPFLGRLHTCMIGSVALFNRTVLPEARAELDDRAVANSIGCHARMGLRREFQDEPGFHVIRVRGLELLNIRDRAVLRPKKVDANGRHRNHTSLQQKHFDRQIPLPEVPSEAVRLILGYEPTPGSESVKRVTIGRPWGLWVSQVHYEDGVVNWKDITPVRDLFALKGRRAKTA